MTKQRAVFNREVSSVVAQIRDKYAPEKIILFGSVARNKATSNSDIDLLIVKRTTKRMVDRIRDVLCLCDYSIPIEPIVYTPSEVKKRLAMGDFFLKEIFAKGKIVYGHQ